MTPLANVRFSSMQTCNSQKGSSHQPATRPCHQRAHLPLLTGLKPDVHPTIISTVFKISLKSTRGRHILMAERQHRYAARSYNAAIIHSKTRTRATHIPVANENVSIHAGSMACRARIHAGHGRFGKQALIAAQQSKCMKEHTAMPYEQRDSIDTDGRRSLFRSHQCCQCPWQSNRHDQRCFR